MAPGIVRRQLSSSSSANESSDTRPVSSGPSHSSASSSGTKRERGPTRGIGLEKFMKTNKGKMAIEIPIDKGRPVDVIQSAKLSSEIGIVARNLIPVPRRWADLSQEDKDLAYERILGRFTFNEGDHVRSNVEALLSQRSRDQRCRLHKKYTDFGNDELARRFPPKNISLENWLDLCDLYADKNYQRWCAINKENRSKKTIPHNTGSRSFVAERNAQRKQTGVEPGRIDFYESTRSKGGNWMSKEAEERHEKMVTMMRDQESNLTEDEVADQILGTRSDYVMGLGYGPKPPSRRARSSQNKAQLEEALRQSTKKQEELEARVEAMQTSHMQAIKAQQDQYNELKAILVARGIV